ncbi:MAG: hypothetical protein FJW90_04805 [Actinobacteria bacterium]|nr:hypothetical protein [Actinomycetota bacterium]
MDFSKLHRSEVVGVIAGLLLAVSLFLPWYSLGGDVTRDEPDDWVCGVGSDSCSAWATFPILRWLLLLAAAAPLILSWIVIREHQLTWPRGELTAIAGLAALVLIFFNGVIDKPSENDIEVSLAWGYLIAILASVGIFIAGGFRAVDSGGGAQRKPPATF